jgi:hypothetical protein
MQALFLSFKLPQGTFHRTLFFAQVKLAISHAQNRRLGVVCEFLSVVLRFRKLYFVPLRVILHDLSSSHQLFHSFLALSDLFPSKLGSRLLSSFVPWLIILPFPVRYLLTFSQKSQVFIFVLLWTLLALSVVSLWLPLLFTFRDAIRWRCF